MGEKDLDVLGHIAIEDKDIQSLFELGVSLPEQGLASLHILWQKHLREALLELLEQDQLFAHDLVVALLHIFVGDPVGPEVEQFGNQVADGDLNRCPELGLSTLGDDLKCQHEQILSLRKILVALVVL